MNVRHGMAVLALSIGALGVTAPAASALPLGVPPARTLCAGGGTGIGMIAAYYDPDRNYSGDPTLWIRPEFVFAPDRPGGSCGVTVTVSWRNSDTGVFGTMPPIRLDDNTPVEENVAGAWVPVSIPSGLGRVEVLIATDSPHVPGKGVFVAT
ncbi:hypothetical protein [Nocardia beijingensis]|uniref:hypothetical protein n=1 Tax=Nocardia beijingensis TaxID=95162 RepID=UPI000AAF4C2F|nr:hypothetical protein [Nocardia beijingensis]